MSSRRHHHDIESLRMFEALIRKEDEILEAIRAIHRALAHPSVRGFEIHPLIFHPQHPRKESFMSTAPVTPNLTPLDPGSSPQFTATPTPVGATLPAGVVPTWTSSDPNSPVTVDATGLIATLVIAATAVAGDSIVLTITAALPDGTTPTGTFTVTVGQATGTEVTGFNIVQSA